MAALFKRAWRRRAAERFASGDGAQPLGVGGFLAVCGRYIRPHWRAAALILAAICPYAIFVTLEPVILQRLIDEAILPRDIGRAIQLTLALLGLLALQAAGDLVQNYSLARTVAELTNEMRQAMFEQLQRLTLTFYQRAKAGDLMARFTTDVEAVDQSLRTDIPYALAYLLTIGLGTAVLFTVDWRMAAISMAATPLVFVGPRIFGRRAEQASYERQTEAARVSTVVQEQLQTHLVSRAFELQGLMLARFRREVRRLGEAATRAGLLAGLMTTTVTMSGSVLLVISICGGTYLAVQGHISPGELVAFVEVFWWMVASVQQLAELLPQLQRAAGGMTRIEELLREPSPAPDSEPAAALPPLSSGIELREVTFSYDGAGRQIDGVTLRIEAGQSVALVGPSGCGKSTLLSLLMRFIEPTGGAILFDGRNLQDLPESALRRQMSVVFQDSLLFDTTVRENIRLGRLNATDEEVEQAGQAAELHDAVMALPNGYDTMVGERGSRLSGGQRQRIAIARAIIRDPRILLLDEATSALDAATEAAVNATLQRLSRRRTVISVTHRLGSVTGADLIVVLDAGRVVEQGTHEELLRGGGMYHRLWQRQSGFALSADGRRVEMGVERLARVPLFEGIDLELLRPVANLFFTERFNPGDLVFRAGDAGDKFYVLARGTAEVLRPLPEGERVAEVLQDGDFTGELELLKGESRQTSLRCRTECTFLALARDHFQTLTSTIPVLRAVFEQVVEVRAQQERMRQAAMAGDTGWSDLG